MKHTNLVFLCYGSDREYRRTIFCLLSFFAHHPSLNQIRVNIYTDSQDPFDGYFYDKGVEFHLLTTKILMEMLGGSDYIHRRKIAVIDETFKRYPNDNLVFVDSDTFFTDNSAEMFENIRLGRSYMHLREYTFQNGLNLFASFNQAKEPADFIQFIESSPLMISGKKVQITRHHYCWNSGVLGLDKTISNLLPDVFRLSDAFYKYSKWFISEQLAFSIVLDQVSRIHPADRFVVHYWGKRQKALMDDFLSENLELMSTAPDLEKVKALTRRLKRMIVNDILKEKAVIALKNRSWSYGIKRAIYAIMKNPGNVSLFKELWRS